MPRGIPPLSVVPASNVQSKPDQRGNSDRVLAAAAGVEDTSALRSAGGGRDVGRKQEDCPAFSDGVCAGDTTTLEEITAADVVDHSAPPRVTSGRRGLLDAVAMFRSAFPDLKIIIEQEVADGEFAAVYGQVIGTNHGPMMGMPPTGNMATFAYMDMYRIVSGRITETWHVEEIAGMLRQLRGQ